MNILTTLQGAWGLLSGIAVAAGSVFGFFARRRRERIDMLKLLREEYAVVQAELLEKMRREVELSRELADREMNMNRCGCDQ